MDRFDAMHAFARVVEARSFHARYPEIQIDMGVSDRMVDLIGENVDCVVRGGELTDPSLMARRLGDLPLGVYAAPDYLARAGMPVHPQALDDARHSVVGFVWSRTGKTVPYAMHRGSERVEAQGRCSFSFDDGNAYLEAGLAALGILWLKGHDRTAWRPSRRQPDRPFQSMYAASTYRMLANTRLSFFTGRLCAALAPSGAVNTLQAAITTSAGSQM
jgi:DNA-binding transcriptional LysR family regulator